VFLPKLYNFENCPNLVFSVSWLLLFSGLCLFGRYVICRQFACLPYWSKWKNFFFSTTPTNFDQMIFGPSHTEMTEWIFEPLGVFL